MGNTKTMLCFCKMQSTVMKSLTLEFEFSFIMWWSLQTPSSSPCAICLHLRERHHPPYSTKLLKCFIDGAVIAVPASSTYLALSLSKTFNILWRHFQTSNGTFGSKRQLLKCPCPASKWNQQSLQLAPAWCSCDGTSSTEAKVHVQWYQKVPGPRSQATKVPAAECRFPPLLLKLL